AGGIGVTNAVNTATTGALSLQTSGVDAAGNLFISETNDLFTDPARLSVATDDSAQIVSLATLGTFTIGDVDFGNSMDDLVITAHCYDVAGPAIIQKGAGVLIGDNIDLRTTNDDIGTSSDAVAVRAGGTLGLQALGSDIFIVSDQDLTI